MGIILSKKERKLLCRGAMMGAVPEMIYHGGPDFAEYSCPWCDNRVEPWPYYHSDEEAKEAFDASHSSDCEWEDYRALIKRLTGTDIVEAIAQFESGNSGSSFDDFLKDEGIFEEVQEVAMKRAEEIKKGESK